MKSGITICLLVVLVVGLGVASGWDYNNQGADWAGVCASGRRQSPIDITSFSQGVSDKLVFDYNLILTGATVKDTQGKGISMVPTAEGSLKQQLLVNQTKIYQVESVHWHIDGEHAFEGKKHDLEMHIVHRAKDVTQRGRAVVVGISFSKGSKSSEFLDEILKPTLPRNDATKTVTCSDMNTSIIGKGKCGNMYQLLSDGMKFYRYDGSLTTPTCDENVTWFVMTKSLPMSEAQYKKFDESLTYSQNGNKGNWRQLPAKRRTDASSQLQVVEVPSDKKPSSAFGLKGSSVLALPLLAVLSTWTA